MNGPTTVTGSSATRSAAKPRPAERLRPEPNNSGMAILTYLRLHWLMILFCGLLLGSGLAYAAYTLLPAKYESYALVLVSSTPPTIASQSDPTRGRTEFATYIKTNAQLIKSEFVLNAALNDAKYRIGELTTLKEQKDPIRYLDEKLIVTFSDSSEVVRISLEGDRPEEIRKIVDAVKDAFFSEVVEKEIKQKAYLKEKVEAARTALEGQMRGKPGFAVEPKLALTPAPQTMPSVIPSSGNPDTNNQPLQQVGGVVPVPAGAVSAAVSSLDSDVVKRAKFNANMQRYTQYEVELAQFPTVIRERQADIELIKKQIEKWKASPPPPEVMVLVEKDPEVMAMRASVKRQTDDYNYLKSVANNPNSDRLERMREKVQSAEAELQKLMHEKASVIDGVNRRAEGERLTRNLEAAERNLRQIEERERVTRKLFEDAKRELAEAPPDCARKTPRSR